MHAAKVIFIFSEWFAGGGPAAIASGDRHHSDHTRCIYRFEADGFDTLQLDVDFDRHGEWRFRSAGFFDSARESPGHAVQRRDRIIVASPAACRSVSD